VSIDRIPLNTLAESTISQLTSLITALVPIVAIAVCAIVRSALMPPAINHSFVNTFLFFILPSLFGLSLVKLSLKLG
jgi:hypothetical protein